MDVVRPQQGYSHFNSPCNLAPVNSPMVLKLPADVMHLLTGKAEEALVFAARTGHISDRGQDMEYRLSSGQVIHGQFPWTHA